MAAIAPEVYKEMGLNENEFDLILRFLGREPTLTELGMFSVMWSEHCGYKYSRPILKAFKKYKEAMEGSGLENAGIVDIGDGLGITMKVESHNHPSAVEPYQGAATGVGGIIRDILTMGARPIALLNSLRFGPIRDGEEAPEVVARNRYLFEHVVEGIAGYGNCVGVPTVAGEVGFHRRYSGNPLVNAMCVGLLRLDQVTTAAAAGTGNPVYYLGSATGKDGIHGATFASDALGEDNEDKRPNVQIGDPFAEKLLIEATLEALETGAIVAIQDMGAAGLTCSTIEMAAKGGVGMSIDLDEVPMRESDMTAYELMLSESQERMFAVVERGREIEIERIYEKWGLLVKKVGIVTNDGKATVRRCGKVEASVTPSHLADQCPTYTSEIEIPAYFRKAADFDPKSLPAFDPNDALLQLLGCPEVASKRFVWQQYDQHVQTQTIVLPGAADAAVLAPRGTKKGIAVKLDGNGRQVYLHPRNGGMLAVVEAARNVACTGARPTAITDGLNYGNPQKPHVYWQFKESVEGIAEAAELMGTPVISGNVSFYNESDLGEVLPTPLIGMLGVMDDASKAIGMAPTRPSGVVYLIETPLDEVVQRGMGASLYASEIAGVEDGYPTAPNVPMERALCEVLVELVSQGLLDWAHDLSEGGLGIAAAEVCIVGKTGMRLELAESDATGQTSIFFGEWPGRVIVGVDPIKAGNIEQMARVRGLSIRAIGEYNASDSDLRVVVGGDSAVHLPILEMVRRYEGAIPSCVAS